MEVPPVFYLKYLEGEKLGLQGYRKTKKTVERSRPFGLVAQIYSNRQSMKNSNSKV